LEKISSDPPKIEEGPLFKALKETRTVILRGLEDRPDLKQRLAGLLCETPHILLGGHLHFIRDLPGKIILLDSSEPEIASAPDTKSMATVCDADTIEKNRAVFLMGPPGSGKSYAVQDLAEKLGVKLFYPGCIGKRHTDDFLREVLKWAKHKSEHSEDPILLAIDEANLAEKHFWQMFAGFFTNNPPQITLLGETILLKKSHRIIFTGNDDSTPGRTVDPMIRKHFKYVRFENMPEDDLLVQTSSK
jgi:hypothetical protein